MKASNERQDIIAVRNYHKCADRMAVFIREVSGGNIDGTMFQFEVWKNNLEEADQRDTSGDMFYIRGLYYNKLHSMLDDGWKKDGNMVVGHPLAKHFNPEEL
jgi:hypothetical protein